ncbi:hypothetical protein MOOR_16760 [Moorella thermoacetica]|uniref:DUF3800 domain-containing protein n=2 Tax=Neomoorella thermoacetica TaxID=1525 RepID=A0A1J5JHV1_NEOTH|nr:hypothetical protein MOOR_16760 [Moorella thermoacetica]
MPKMPRKKILIYHDESGTPGVDKVFVSGVLILDKERQGEDILNVVNTIRKKWNYHEEFHFQKMSTLKYNVYKDLLETCLKYCNFRFSAIVIQKQKLDMRYFNHQHHLAYNFFTKMVIYHNIKWLSGRAYIFSDSKNRIKRDNFLEYLKEQLNIDSLFYGHGYHIRAIETPSSSADNLLQVADLFTGIVKQKFDPAPGHRKVSLKDIILSNKNSRYKINIWDWTPHTMKNK